jgi:hypothetical protein
VTGSCEHGNQPSGSTKDGGFLAQLSDYQLLKKDSAPWSHYAQVGNSELW